MINNLETTATSQSDLPQPQPETRPKASLSATTLLSAVRIRQWVKNLLIFTPIVLGGALGDPKAIFNASLCFLAMGLLASGTYLINDLIDVESDRKHPTKRHRAIASGKLRTGTAVGLAAFGLTSGLLLGAALGLSVFIGLLAYLIVTLAYSLRLKQMPIVDAVTLGTLYTWRIILGSLVSGVVLSAWLLVFSFAFFFSLSLAKRYAEVTSMVRENRSSLTGRGYRVEDGIFILVLGISSGVSSILIFVLYMIEGAFKNAAFTWTEVLWVCPIILLSWLSRVWLLAGRGELNEDPVEFAIRDGKSLIMGAAGVVAVLIALLA